MLLLSLKTLVMLKMQFVVVMDINLMVTVCELSWHMVGEDILHLWTDMAVEVAVEELAGTLTIVFWSLDCLLQHHGRT